MNNFNKHLTYEQRTFIERGLNENRNFTEIGRLVGKDPSTISKEVRRHRTIKQWRDPNRMPQCSLRNECHRKHVCADCKSYIECHECHDCRRNCPDYTPKICGRLKHPPYVCNGCPSLIGCRYYRYIYVAKYADDCYHELLVSSREGLNQTPEDMQMMDQMISPLIRKGQSIAHIYASHGKDLPCSRRTLYEYIDKNVFTVRNIDLPRKVKYKARKSKGAASPSVDRAEKLDRSYDDFLKLLQKEPDTKVVEMDTVEGQKGGKVLLTLFFRNCSLMTAMLIKEKTQECVQEALNNLSDAVGIKNFRKMFGVILTDNGSEFLNTGALECDRWGEIKTRIYYCDPNCAWQKGMIEKNHEYIRYIISKGSSFDRYTQDDITLLMNHINSTARDSLNGCTPYKLSLLLLNNRLHQALSLQEILPDDVVLKPALLKH